MTDNNNFKPARCVTIQTSIVAKFDSGESIEVEKSLHELVYTLINSEGGNVAKIPLIKYVRSQYGIGLREAKDFVEVLSITVPFHQTRY